MKTLHVIIMLVCAGFLVPGWSGAADRVVVIPLMSHQSKPLKNVVTVAKKNGDFTDPVAAMNSITDAAADNPYLIVIAPGVYTLTETLAMKPHVSITGSGEDVTILTGTIGSQEPENAAIINLTNYVSLSNLSVHNTGNVGSKVVGIYSYLNYRHTKIRKISIEVSGNGTNHYGVFLNNSNIVLDSVTINVSGASMRNTGIRSYTVSSSGWITTNRPLLVNTNISAAGGQTSYALISVQLDFNGEAHDEPIIRRSTLEGGSAAISSGHFLTVSQSTLIGGISGDNPNVIKCVACDDGQGNALNNNCNP